MNWPVWVAQMRRRVDLPPVLQVCLDSWTHLKVLGM